MNTLGNISKTFTYIKLASNFLCTFIKSSYILLLYAYTCMWLDYQTDVLYMHASDYAPSMNSNFLAMCLSLLYSLNSNKLSLQYFNSIAQLQVD